MAAIFSKGRWVDALAKLYYLIKMLDAFIVALFYAAQSVTAVPGDGQLYGSMHPEYCTQYCIGNGSFNFYTQSAYVFLYLHL